MTPSLRLGFAVALLCICLAGCSGGVQGSNAKLRAASVLFDEFETIFYSDASSLSARYNQLPGQAASFLRIPFAYLTGGLDSLGGRAAEGILAAADGVLVGAKDFRAPTGLGGVESTFCYVVVLKKPGSLNILTLVKRSPATRVIGAPVWVWETPPQEGHPQPFTFYMTEVARSYVLVSNSSEQLRAISGRLSSSTGGRNVPVGVPEWREVSRHAYWGYRRYRQVASANRDASGLSNVTSTARDLIFLVDFKEKRGLLRLLASDASTADKLNSAPMDPSMALPPLRRSAPGVWEAAFPFTGRLQTEDRMFVVMGLFGFGIYL